MESAFFCAMKKMLLFLIELEIRMCLNYFEVFGDNQVLYESFHPFSP